MKKKTKRRKHEKKKQAAKLVRYGEQPPERTGLQLAIVTEKLQAVS